MEESELIRDQEEYAKILAYQQKVKNAVARAIRQGKEEVRVGNRVFINVKLLEKDKNNNSIDNYIFESRDKSITGKATRDEKKKIDVDIDLEPKVIHRIMDEKRREHINRERRVEKHQVTAKSGEDLKLEVKKGLVNGNATRMEGGRENTNNSTLLTFFRTSFGEKNIRNIYRVKGRDPHDFKYVIERNDGTYKEANLSTLSEGENTYQKIWLMRGGKLVEKNVDSLLLKGRFGIATDIPESVGSDNTTSYMVQRLPNGQYLGIELAQASGVNRNTSGNVFQKELMSRTKSIYDMQKTAKEASLAKKIEPIMRDSTLTTEELMLVKKLKEEKNMTNNEVKLTVDTIACLKEMGFSCNEIKPMLSKWDKESIKNLSKKVKEESITKKDVKEGRIKDDDKQKLPGDRMSRRSRMGW